LFFFLATKGFLAKGVANAPVVLFWLVHGRLCIFIRNDNDSPLFVECNDSNYHSNSYIVQKSLRTELVAEQ
ncbi:hypothetical protein OESDEN_15660, partial [Oesophagostomum dentatum]